MTFSDLQPGQLVRIPRVHAQPGELAPVVRVEADMHACADGLCPCWVVTTRDIDTGLARPYHREPGFAITVITPEPKETA